MRAVFLRGAVPPKHEHPEKLLYDSIDQCEDMWTQLFYHTLQKLGARGELYYAKGNREFVVDSSFTERWVRSIKEYDSKFKPDVIICRGGFPYYDGYLRRHPKAIKIYYGAGCRYYPTSSFTDYDLFLIDSQVQIDKVLRKKGPKPTTLWMKPSATMFRPVDVPKKYDVCFMANAAQYQIKRHWLFMEQFRDSGLKILHLGNNSNKLKAYGKEHGMDITWGGWDLRNTLAPKISQCRVGVNCSTDRDSCPRVIPEYLSCGLPVVVTDNVNFWQERYINEHTGRLCGKKELANTVKDLLNDMPDPAKLRAYWQEHLSMDRAASDLAEHIRILRSNK